MTTYLRSVDGLEIANAQHIKRIAVTDGESLKTSTVFIRFVDGLPFHVFSCPEVSAAIEFAEFLAKTIQGTEATSGGVLDLAEVSALFNRMRNEDI